MVYIALAAGIFGLDFVLKRHFDEKYARGVRHAKGKLVIEKYYNEGATLNLLAKRPKLMRAIHSALMLVVGAIAFLLARQPGKHLCKLGTAMLAGGGLSNLYDRHVKGHVVDYFHINAGPKWFRNIIFNLSDFFVFLGVILAVAGSDME
ncbi:MAG: signal peptidase II [Roseburia sp.]